MISDMKYEDSNSFAFLMVSEARIDLGKNKIDKEVVEKVRSLEAITSSDCNSNDWFVFIDSTGVEQNSSWPSLSVWFALLVTSDCSTASLHP